MESSKINSCLRFLFLPQQVIASMILLYAPPGLPALQVWIGSLSNICKWRSFHTAQSLNAFSERSVCYKSWCVQEKRSNVGALTSPALLHLPYWYSAQPPDIKETSSLEESHESQWKTRWTGNYVSTEKWGDIKIIKWGRGDIPWHKPDTFTTPTFSIFQ